MKKRVNSSNNSDTANRAMMQAPSSPPPPPDEEADVSSADDVGMVEDDDDDAGYASPILNRETVDLTTCVTTVLPSPTFVEEEDGVYREFVVSDDDVDFINIDLDQEEDDVDKDGSRPVGKTASGTSSRKITSGTMGPRLLKELSMEGLEEENDEDGDSETKLPSSTATATEPPKPAIPTLSTTPTAAPRPAVSTSAASAMASPDSTTSPREFATSTPTSSSLMNKLMPTPKSPRPQHAAASALSPRTHNRQLKQIQAMIEDTAVAKANASSTNISSASKSDKKGRPLLRYMNIRKWGSGGSSGNASSTKQQQHQHQDNRPRTGSKEDVQQQQQQQQQHHPASPTNEYTRTLPERPTSSSPTGHLTVDTDSINVQSRSMESNASSIDYDSPTVVAPGGHGTDATASALTTTVMPSWDESYLEEDYDGDVAEDDEDDGEVDADEDEEEDVLFGASRDDDDYDDAYDSPDDDTGDFCYMNMKQPIDWNALSAFPLPANFLENATAGGGGEDEPPLGSMGYINRRRSSAASVASGETGGGQHQHYSAARTARTPAVFTQDDADECVYEDGMLLQAVWELLAERDQIGVEGSTDQSDNIWKKGPLKKLSTMTTAKISVNMWKVKYVELRRGNLCYYEDSGQVSGRKIIHLRHTDTIVQASDRSSNQSSSTSGTSSTTDKNSSTDNAMTSTNPSSSVVSGVGVGVGSGASVGASVTSGRAAGDDNANVAPGGGTGGGGHEQRSGEGKSSSGGGGGSGGGRSSKLFCFEIIQLGSPKHVFQARSEEERQSWLQAIRAAMIGSSEDDIDTINHTDDDGKKRRKRQLDLVTHKKALDVYSQLRHELQKTNITCSQDYYNVVTKAIRKLTVNAGEDDVTSGNDNIDLLDALTIPTLRVPVQWVRDQLAQAQQGDGTQTGTTSALDSKPDSTHTSSTATTPIMSPHKKLKAMVADFWKNMSEITFGVNGLVLPKESPYASERIVGALTRCILEFDKAFSEDGEMDMNQSGLISELQAVAYARNILMTVLKSKQQQDVACTIYNLLQNDQVILKPEPSEDTGIVHLEVSFAGDDLPDDQTDTEHEISLWFRTRRKNSATSKWRRRFAVLSGVVLSYYEAATPRPHGLRGQLVLSGAIVQQEESFSSSDTSKEDRFVLLLSTLAEERWLSFETEADMDKWKAAIQEGIDSCDAPSLSLTEGKNKGKSILKMTESVLKGAIPDSGIRVGARVVRGATGSGVRVIRSAKDGGIKVFRTAVGMLRHKPSSSSNASTGTTTSATSLSRRPSMQLLMSNAVDGDGSNKREPTVQCVAQQTYSFAVNEAVVTTSLPPRRLFTVNAKLFQAFLLTGGGKSGRLSRGDALIEMEFLFTGTGDEDEGRHDVIAAATTDDSQPLTDDEFGYGGPINI